MRFVSFLLVFGAFLTFASCGPSQRELAVQKTNVANQILAKGDTMLAIQYLDSISILYPKAEIQIGVAKNFKNNIYRQLIDTRKNQITQTDSLITVFEKKFNKEKTPYDRYTQYIHKRQTLNRSWDRSYLKIHLDERGELMLSSNYLGEEWLSHTGIRVYDGKLQAKTEKVPLDDPNNHRSDFMDYKWEKIMYRQGKADSVIQFISNNMNRNLKCVFLGKRYYYILLESYDKEAVSDALNLSSAIKKKKQLQREITSMQAKRSK